MPGAIATKAGQTLRTKLLKRSQSLVKDIRGSGSGWTRMLALLKGIIKIYDVYLSSFLGSKFQLPGLAIWQKRACVISFL